MTRRDKNERRETVLLALGCVVVLTEVIGVLIQQAFPTHPLPTEFHILALTVATTLFGGAALASKKQNGNSESGA